MRSSRISMRTIAFLYASRGSGTQRQHDAEGANSIRAAPPYTVFMCTKSLIIQSDYVQHAGVEHAPAYGVFLNDGDDPVVEMAPVSMPAGPTVTVKFVVRREVSLSVGETEVIRTCYGPESLYGGSRSWERKELDSCPCTTCSGCGLRAEPHFLVSFLPLEDTMSPGRKSELG
jgi:hypothetical protein